MKNNNIKYKVFTFAILMAAFASCEEEQEVADVVPQEGLPTVSVVYASSDVPTTTNEADETEYVYTVTLDKMHHRPISVTATQVGGTASSSDYTISNAVIAPYTTEARITVTVATDEEFEEPETLEVEVGLLSPASKYDLNNADLEPTNLSLTIENHRSSTLVVGLEWEVTDYLQEDATDVADLGMEIYALADDSYIDGADGGSFEEVELDFTELADGDYLISTYAYYIKDLVEVSEDQFEVPLTVTFSREGVFTTKSISEGFEINNYPQTDPDVPSMNTFITGADDYDHNLDGVQDKDALGVATKYATGNLVVFTKSGDDFTFQSWEEYNQ